MTVGFRYENPFGRAPTRPFKAEPSPNLYFIAVNTAHAPLNVREVRHALAMSVDREGLLRSLKLSDVAPAYAMAPTTVYGTVIHGRAPYAALRPDMRTAIAGKRQV